VTQPSFATEDDARRYLEALLEPWFHLKREVGLRYPGTANRLRIDYLAKPKPATPFPFDLFGIECKRSNRAGEFNRAIKQAIDYCRCEIADQRPTLGRLLGQRVERVYVFPAPGEGHGYEGGWHGGVERLGGLFHVGLITVRAGMPVFSMSADRQWDPRAGPSAAKKHIRQLVGNGAARRPEMGAPP